MVSDVILTGYLPGAIGRIVELHANYYYLNWGFGLFFEARVAKEMSEFLSRFDETRDGLWIVWLNDRIEGGVAIDGVKAATDGAHLRWFILSSEVHSQGFGKRLMEEAISFCKKKITRKSISKPSRDSMRLATSMRSSGLGLYAKPRGLSGGKR
jgi:GNAT superfamily N-acetyltransferase